MKKLLSFWIGIISFGFTTTLSASLDIHCPSDKEITYSQYQAGNYWDKPVVYGGHTKYGPWIYPHLNCGSGYVDVKWEIVDHYGRSYYCTQTIWINSPNSYGGISVWCPKEMTIYCDQIDNINYLKPEVTGSNYWIYGPWISKSLNDCGVGSLWVEWKVVDGCGKNYYCKSAIWVKPRPGYAKISWPKDFTADLCKDNIDPKYLPWPYGYPEIYQKNPCAKYGFSYQDLEFTFPNDTGICKKILRKWTVIDWCTYDLNGYGHGSSGKWEYSQVIKIISKAKPIISCIPEIKVNQEAYGPFAWIDIPVPTVTSTCNGLSKLTHNSIYATKPGSDASGNYPIGTTLVIFKATDPCGNIAVCTTRVIVSDKTLPTPYCIGSLVVGIGKHADGVYIVIDPKKFDVGSFDNNTPKDKLKFTAIPNRFTCDSLGIRKVKIVVTDEAGNSDFCIVTLNLQDNMGFCPKPPAPPAGDTLAISGLLANAYAAPVDSVNILLTSSQVSQSMMANGKYKASKLKSGKDYKLIPSKRKGFMEGVTVDDYTLLIDHLQGKDTLEDPYQLLAADINLDDTIDMDDAFLLGYYILTYSNGQADSLVSWRFLPTDFDVTSIDPLSNTLRNVPRHREYKSLDSTIFTADFIGIKIGDLDGSGIYETSDTQSILALKSKWNSLSQTKMVKNFTLERPISLTNTSEAIVLSHPKTFSKVNLYPNPFTVQTTLQFITPNAEKAVLEIFDMNGRLVLTQSQVLNKGLNAIRIEGTDLRQQGIYLYHLRTASAIYHGKFSYLY